jgi:putative transport protein
MDTVVIALLQESPLLLLFAVAAVGYGLGRVRLGGLTLGVAAVLFVGLGVGALHPDLKLPEFVYQFGLVLFVYGMGLSAGPGFLASLKRQGLAQNGLVFGVLCACALFLLGLKHWLGLPGALVAGVFAGSLTNTPALAGLLDHLRHLPGAADAHLVAEPVVGYSLAYPFGVIGMVLAMAISQRLWGPAGPAEAGPGAPSRQLANLTVRVTQPDGCGQTLLDLQRRHAWPVVFGRLQRHGELHLAQDDTTLALDDLISVIGSKDDVQGVAEALGEVAPVALEFDRSQLDFRRLFVSNGEVVGRPLHELHLGERFGARVTRVRRGDVDLLAHRDTVLQPGDRVRVVAPPESMPAVSALFGDSYRQLSEVDAVSLGMGIALGLLLGLVPIPLGSLGTFKLGFAAGPLIAGLVLGAWGKTGAITWSLPYSANLTLRQIGLLLFLAGVGTRSGYAFASAIAQGGWARFILAGAAVTTLAALATLVIGYRLVRLPRGALLGVLAGLQTQPAVLAFAAEQAGEEEPHLAYATVFPLAMVAKIVLAQLLLLL